MGMNNGYPFATKAQIAERIRNDAAYRQKCVDILDSLGLKADPDNVDRYARRLARYFRELDLQGGVDPEFLEKAKQYGVVPGVKPEPRGARARVASTPRSKTPKKPKTVQADPLTEAIRGPQGSLPDMILDTCVKGMTMTSIAKALPDASPADIVASVAKLVQAGALKKSGRGPGTRYQVAA